MKLALHLLRKDVRVVRRTYLLWLALVFLSMLPPIFGVGAGTDLSPFYGDNNYGRAFTLLKIMALCLVVGEPIFLDPSADDRAFWRTRPISPGLLLWSKFLGWSAMVALPLALADAFAAASLGATGLHVVEVSLQTASGTLAAAAMLGGVAAVADRRRPYLVLLGLIPLTFAMMLYVTAHFDGELSADLFQLLPPASVISEETRAFVALTWLAAVSIGVSVHQYFTQRTFRSFVFGAAGFALTSLVRSCWPIDFFPSPVVQRLTSDAVSVQASPLDPSPRWTTDHHTYSSLEISGLTPDQFLVFDECTSTLISDDGQSRSLCDHVRDYGYTDAPIEFALAQQLGSPRGERSAEVLTVPLLDRSAKAISEFAGARGKLQARLTFAVCRLNRWAQLPLQKGARLTQKGQAVQIEQVSFTSRPELLLRHAEISAWDARPAGSDRLGLPQRLYTLAVPTATSAILNRPSFLRGYTIKSSGTIMVLTQIENGRVTIGFHLPKTGPSAVDLRWLNQAYLAIFTIECVGQIEKTVSLENVTVPTAEEPETKQKKRAPFWDIELAH